MLVVWDFVGVRLEKLRDIFVKREFYLFCIVQIHIESESYDPFKIIRGPISQGHRPRFIRFQVGESHLSIHVLGIWIGSGLGST